MVEFLIVGPEARDSNSSGTVLHLSMSKTHNLPLLALANAQEMAVYPGMTEKNMNYKSNKS